MRFLTASDLLRIWESGETQAPLLHALTLLSAAYPDLNAEQLTDLSLGQRDRRLFLLHQRLFGPELRGFAECPQCRERLEFSWPLPALDDAELVEPPSAEQTVFAAGFEMRLRLLTSRDLIAAANCSDPRQARSLLVERCLQEVRREGIAISVAELPEAVTVDLANRLAECDPWQEVLFDLVCPACGNCWQLPLDIVTFLEAELASHARRLLREVHMLARAYGWREADILALSARRRHSYLEMVGT